MRLIYILFFVFLNTTFCKGQIVISDLSSAKDISSDIMIFEDKTSKMTIDEVKNKAFKPTTQKVENLGVSNSTFWIKFTLTNFTNESNFVLEYSYPTTDSVTFFTEYPKNNFKQITISEKKPFRDRKYQFPNYLFDIQLHKEKTETYYLKINSSEQILLPLKIGTKDAIIQSTDSTRVLGGIYIGIIIALALYNIFIYISTKDKTYLFYVIHTVLVGLTQSTFMGFTFQYLWPNNLWLSMESLMILTCGVSIAGILFLIIFLKIKENSSFFYPIYLAYILLYIIIIILNISNFKHFAYNSMQLLQLSISIIILINAILLSIKGFKAARFYLFAWVTFMIGILIYILKDFGILPYNYITLYTMPVGSAMEALLLSFALADRINILKKEKEVSQAQSLEILRENERIILEQNTVLEQKVNERTIDLRNTNSELSATLLALKETQSQLVNSEKMASLGQLTAGVAHEINNPINFVVSNVNPLRRDILDLQELLDKYGELKNDDSIDRKLAEIEKFKREIDITYVKDEIEILLKGITEGANRTAEIVQSLKTFSRVDETDLKKANINDGLKSSIVLLTQQLSKIDLVLDYGELPLIECFPGKLNQVFMNILTNAIEAINYNLKKDEVGTLMIRTFLKDNEVVISIKDSGHGMSEEVKKKIFEPFFTTKDVGKGTGLGLSITIGIIEKHKGNIRVESELGKGTEFIIQLPIKRDDIF